MKQKVLVIIDKEADLDQIYLLCQLMSKYSVDVRICLISEKTEKQETDSYLFYFVEVDHFSNHYSKCLSLIGNKMNDIFEDFLPDTVLLNGVSLFHLGACISSYFVGAQVAVIEPNLHHFNKMNNFPDEMTLALISDMIDIVFVSTNSTEKLLIHVGLKADKIYQVDDWKDAVIMYLIPDVTQLI